MREELKLANDLFILKPVLESNVLDLKESNGWKYKLSTFSVINCIHSSTYESDKTQVLPGIWAKMTGLKQSMLLSHSAEYGCSSWNMVKNILK